MWCWQACFGWQANGAMANPAFHAVQLDAVQQPCCHSWQRLCCRLSEHVISASLQLPHSSWLHRLGPDLGCSSTMGRSGACCLPGQPSMGDSAQADSDALQLAALPGSAPGEQPKLRKHANDFLEDERRHLVGDWILLNTSAQSISALFPLRPECALYPRCKMMICSISGAIEPQSCGFPSWRGRGTAHAPISIVCNSTSRSRAAFVIAKGMHSPHIGQKEAAQTAVGIAQTRREGWLS